MIKALQKKFIKTAMTAITVLLLVFIVGVNAVNILTFNREYSGRLDVLSESIHNKQPPEMSQLEPEKNDFKDFLSPMPDEERVERSRYFVAELDESSEIVSLDIDNIPNMTVEEAEDLIKEAMTQSTMMGTVGEYEYRVVQASDKQGISLIFIDNSTERRQVLSVALISISVGMICWIAMLVLVSVLSKRAIKPIAESIEQQKQFVANAGHEIKTPLAIILANTEALELHTGENKWSRNIKDQTIRLNGLMQNLLTLSKNEEAEAELNKELFAAKELLDEIIEEFSSLAESKEIFVEATEDLTLCSDRECVRQLFTLLIDNAIKYAEKDIFISLTKENENIVFTIKNKCESLPACEPERLFDRFYRDDEARTQKSGGYGIGLSVARVITERLGGTIKAEYEKDNTIAFKVKI